MTFDRRAIRWRIHLAAAPSVVFDTLVTDAGRERFWVHSSREDRGRIAFRFLSGESCDSVILVSDPPRRFELTYFGGSRVAFGLEEDRDGGTVLELTETGVPESEWADNHAGWITVLLSLKAAVDFGVDLRNGDSERGWRLGFVDV